MKQKIKKLITFLLLLVVGFEYGYSVSNYNKYPVQNLKYTISGIYASVAPSYENIGYEAYYYYYSQDHYDVPEA